MQGITHCLSHILGNQPAHWPIITRPPSSPMQTQVKPVSNITHTHTFISNLPLLINYRLVGKLALDIAGQYTLSLKLKFSEIFVFFSAASLPVMKYVSRCAGCWLLHLHLTVGLPCPFQLG